MLIENTLGSLASLTLVVWIATQAIKRGLPRVPQLWIALAIGELATLAVWRVGLVHLDGAMVETITSNGLKESAPSSDPWAWVLVMLYALISVATAAKAHDAGSEPKTLVKRVKDGKPID